MKINNINNLSFGTKPIIGDNQAYSALPKYSINLTNGILDAFEKFIKNGVNDELVINIGRNGNTKNISTDRLHIDYWKDNKLISSKSFSPKMLSKKSAKKISSIIRKTYEELKNSTKQDTISGGGYAVGKKYLKISKQHQNKINLLVDKFGYDDWTCA